MINAYGNLRDCQTQLDADGCMVGVSRQALDELLTEYFRLYKVEEELDGARKRLENIRTSAHIEHEFRILENKTLSARAQSAEAALREMRITKAAEDVLAERKRQISAEGWTPEHDDRHEARELARAAAVYALHVTQPPKMIFSHELQEEIPENWPWAKCYFKPRGPRRDLVRAGALILAEIERIDRSLVDEIDKGSTL